MIDFTASPSWAREGSGEGPLSFASGSPDVRGNGSTCLFFVTSGGQRIDVLVSVPSDAVLDLEKEKTYRVQIEEVV